jgi:pyrroline-5-carboxylate reductase
MAEKPLAAWPAGERSNFKRHAQMKRMKIVFLGGGHITSALIAGLRLARYEHSIVVHDRNEHKLHALRREFHVEIARDLKSAVAQAGMLMIAVRPASVSELMREIAQSGAARRPMIAVSLAAGIPLKKLRKLVGAPVRWARAMPSPVCRIGRGLTVVAFDHGLSANNHRLVRKFFAQVGPVLDLPEEKFDAFTASFSPSYGYHALTTLAAAAQATGLDRKTALAAAAHALADSIFYWREGGQELEDMQREAATPGGTAAATIAAMDRAGYRKVVAAGLKAGIAQGRRNAKL